MLEQFKAVLRGRPVGGFGFWGVRTLSDQELWFTHDGYLFEISTYPTLGPWLTPIINTIRFP